MVGIVLNIQSDQSHGNSVDNRQGITSMLHPAILQIKEESNVTHRTKQVARSSEFFAASNNLKYLLLDFSLEGSARKDLRRTNKKAAEAGLRFEIVPRADVGAMMPQLKAISDAWLEEKSAGEKGFSLGFFNETYLLHYDLALVIQNDRPIAFANLWKVDGKQELSTWRGRWTTEKMDEQAVK